MASDLRPLPLYKSIVDTLPPIANQQNAPTLGGANPTQARAQDALCWELSFKDPQKDFTEKAPEAAGFQMRKSSSLHRNALERKLFKSPN